MALSYTEITLGSGSGENQHQGTVHGPFGFAYLNTADILVRVKVGSAWTALTVSSVDTATKKVTLSASPNSTALATADDVLRIYRVTSLDTLVDFQNGSRLSEADLDTAYRQGLFAAQEAVEDAPASATRTVQATEDIANLAITVDKLAATLDLRTKTVILPFASLTDYGASLKAHSSMTLSSGYTGQLPTANGGTGSANGTYCDLAANVTGVLPVANGGSGFSSDSGRVIEEFLAPCDGVAVNLTSSRTVTPTNITAKQVLTETFADVTGSSITYTPPSGSQFVVYKFTTSVAGEVSGDDPAASFALWLDSGSGFAEVVDFRTQLLAIENDGPKDWGRVNFEWSFPIGGTPALATTGRDSSWTSAKTIKLMAREYSDGDYSTVLHSTCFWEASSTAIEFSRPVIGIKAIG